MAKRSRAPFLAFPLRGVERGGLGAAIHRACAAAIADGRLAAGARVPSSRQLALDWGVARNTVDDALARLQADGLVVRRVGAGTFVAPGFAVRPPAGAHRVPAVLGRRALEAASARGVVAARNYSARTVPRPQAFVAGLPALDAFPLDAWRRLAARRQRASGAALLGYLPASGYPPLRAALADHLAAARGIDCDAGQVMIVNSTMQALDLIARVLLERGDCAWIEDPGYPNLRAVLAMAGARVASVPVDGNGIDVARAPDGVPRPAMICVTPSCQYPTGAVLSVARRLEILRIAAAYDAWIVEDDHHHEFTWSGRPAAPIAALDRDRRTLYVGTFSDTVFPSLRLAYAVLPHALVDVFHAVRRQLDDHTHGFMQAVLADFIGGGHFAAHLRRMRTLYAARRDALARALARHCPQHPVDGLACGLHASLRLPARVRDTDAAARAARGGVRVLPLSRYADCVAANGLLLGYAALSERRIADGVARLAAALDQNLP